MRSGSWSSCAVPERKFYRMFGIFNNPPLTSTMVVLVRLSGGCVAMSSLSLGLIMSEQRLRIKWPFKSLPSVVSLPDCCWSLLLLPGIDDWPSGELVVVGENHWDTREVTRFKIDCNGEIKIHVNIPVLCTEWPAANSRYQMPSRHFY